MAKDLSTESTSFLNGFVLIKKPWNDMACEWAFVTQRRSEAMTKRVVIVSCPDGTPHQPTSQGGLQKHKLGEWVGAGVDL